MFCCFIQDQREEKPVGLYLLDVFISTADINFEMEQPVISVPDTQAVSEEKRTYYVPMAKRL